MGGHIGPRRINLVSLAVFAALAVGAYAVVQLGPVYYRQFQVKEVLDDVVLRYADRGGIAGSTFEDELTDEAERALRDRGVLDAGLRVRFQTQAGRVEVLAEYSEIIEHPLINKITVLHLAPSASRPKKTRPW